MIPDFPKAINLINHVQDCLGLVNAKFRSTVGHFIPPPFTGSGTETFGLDVPLEHMKTFLLNQTKI